MDNTVKVWDARSYRAVHTLRGHTEGVLSVAFSRDGRLATASADKTVKLWDAGPATARTLTQFDGGIRRVAFSPDGGRLATSDRSQTVQVWDTTTGRTVSSRLVGHDGQVWGVAFSPDGKLLATAGVDRTVKLWDADGQLVRTFPPDTPAGSMSWPSAPTASCWPPAGRTRR